MKESKLLYILIGAAAIMLYISNRFWPTPGALLLDIIYSIVLLGGVGMLIFYGSLRRSRYRMPVTLGAAAIIAGIVFNMQEWKGADILTIGGAAAMLVFYTIHFISKTNRGLLDYLKMTWLAAAIAGLIFIVFSLPYAVIVTDAVNILLLAILVLFLSDQPGKPLFPRRGTGGEEKPLDSEE
jgi:hypothetical protein